jgi:hypothetical protein
MSGNLKVAVRFGTGLSGRPSEELTVTRMSDRG